MSVKLVELLRNGTVESVHRGSIAVVNSKGDLLYEMGEVERITFFHSSAKPFQAIAALEAGIVEKFNLEFKEIAIMSSSHIGDKEHIETLNSLMKKIGVEEKQLLCGTHEPYSKEAAKELILAGLSPSELYCNCSGKHLGMLAASKTRSYSLETYNKPEHEIQKEIRNVISDFSGVNPDNIIIATDGCGVPVFGIPLKNMARAFANLGNIEFMGGKYSKSQNYIIRAVTMYPEMIAGKDRMDTELMRRFGDRLFIKTGAEAVSCAALLGRSIGISIKIDDGYPRAVAPAMLELLRQLKVISNKEVEELREYWISPVKSYLGEKVGELKATFNIMQ
jgi:L-asparaginase II